MGHTCPSRPLRPPHHLLHYASSPPPPPPPQVAKCLNYASQPLAANAVFVLFVASWVGLRLYAFPAYVIRSTLLDSRRVLGYTPPHYWLLNGLLCALCVIHVYWFGLILRVLWMTVTAGQAKDIREDDDDDGSGGGE